ncbi:hypothetical protein NE237_023669 [Protea cynaroides]|uniref:Uncharacterized protein n=1 Tax=Protea cynaroides TaxID=273540 RepID=A0A9Q0HFI1_9MAGN|nr:hypothetical protein NE237_023669 [Protea cynaroides]
MPLAYWLVSKSSFAFPVVVSFRGAFKGSVIIGSDIVKWVEVEFDGGRSSTAIFENQLEQEIAVASELHLEEADADPETKPPEISLYALTGDLTPQTMRVQAGSLTAPSLSLLTPVLPTIS